MPNEIWFWCGACALYPATGHFFEYIYAFSFLTRVLIHGLIDSQTATVTAAAAAAAQEVKHTEIQICVYIAMSVAQN